MKKSRKISVFVTVALSLLFLACETPSSSSNNSGGSTQTTPANPEGGGNTPTSPNNPGNTPTTPTTPEGGGNTPTSPDNPGNTPTNPDNPEGGGGTTNPTAPKHEWIFVGNEITSEQHTATYDMISNSVSNYTYSYYNSSYDYKYTSMSQTSGTTTVCKGTEQESTTQTNSESKSVYSSSKNGNIINTLQQSYAKNNDSWELRLEYTTENYKNTWLTQSSHMKQHAYTIINNGDETQVPETESETNYTVELVSNSNGVEQYKVTPTSTPSDYSIYYFKNNIIHKVVKYYSNGVYSRSESIYTRPNNVQITDNLPDFVLLSYKYYDLQDNVVAEYEQTIEDVTLDETLGTLKIKTGQSTNTTTTYTYTTSTYKKMQVPFSNE